MQNLRLNPWFFIPYLVVLVLAGIYLAMHGKGDFLLWVNAHHTAVLDNFFMLTNELGEGIFLLVVVGAMLVFTRYGDGLAGALAWVTAGLVTQFLKRQIFPDYPRPAPFFKGIKELYLVPGVHINEHFSFPSGHTTVAFAICTVLALSVKNKMWGLFFIMMGLIAGLSRIYLSQHFLMDTFVGSIVGSLTGLLVYNVLHLYMDRRPEHLLNRNLLKSLRG